MIGKTNAVFTTVPIVGMAFRDILHGDYRFTKNGSPGSNCNTDALYSQLPLQACAWDAKTEVKKRYTILSQLKDTQNINFESAFKTIPGTKAVPTGYNNGELQYADRTFLHSGYYIEDGFFVIPDISAYCNSNGLRIAWGGTFRKRNTGNGSGAFCLGTEFHDDLATWEQPEYGSARGSADIFCLPFQEGKHIFIDGVETEYFNPLDENVYYEYEIIYNKNKTLTLNIYEPVNNAKYSYSTTAKYRTSNIKGLIIGNGTNTDAQYGSYLLEYLAIYGRQAYVDRGLEKKELWTQKSTYGTVHGTYVNDGGDDGYYISAEDYQQTYKNIAYSPTNIDIDQAAYISEYKEVAGKSDFNSQQKLIFGESVLVYDGQTAPQIPVVFRMEGTDNPGWGWNYNNLRVFAVTMAYSAWSQGLVFANDLWSQSDRWFNVQWMLLDTSNRWTSATNLDSTDYTNGMNNRYISNMFTYQPSNNPYESLTITPEINYKIGYDKGSTKYENANKICTKGVHIFNVKQGNELKNREYLIMSHTSPSYYTTESYNSYIDTMQALEDATPQSYFTESTVNTINSDFNAAIADYTQKIENVISAKTHLCRTYDD